MGKIHERFKAANRINSLMGVMPAIVAKAAAKKKGAYGGICNFTNCLAPGSTPTWYNRGSMSFYCAHCARMLNKANANDSFCKDAALCYEVHTQEEANKLHAYTR